MRAEKPPLFFAWKYPLLLTAALYRFIGLGFGEMQQWDEALYALRTLAVIRFGDLFDQSAHVFGFYYCAHPPLYVWISALFVTIFGDGLWVFRLCSALAAAASVFLVYRIGKEISTGFTALASALFFGFLPIVTFYSRQGQLDLLLTFFMLAYVLAFLLHHRTRKRSLILIGGLSLAAALLTKSFFAGGIVLVLGGMSLTRHRGKDENLMEPKSESRRARGRGGLLFPAVTLGIAVLIVAPWYIGMTLRHGGGDPLFFLTGDTPIGQTLTGGEGTAKWLGAFYYLNQLVVHLSFLFPFSILGIVKYNRSGSEVPARSVSGIVIFYFLVVSLAGSKFTVYIVPIIAYLAIAGFDYLERTGRGERNRFFLLAALSVICGIWSISADWRITVKSALSALWSGNGSLPAHHPGALLVMGTLLLFLLTGLLLLHRRGRLRSILHPDLVSLMIVGLGIFTFTRMINVEPDDYSDGAGEIARMVADSNGGTLFLVGEGINPQLTYYLNGADIGWEDNTELTVVRLEPVKETPAAVRDRIAAAVSGGGRILAVVEKDEITMGFYESYTEVIPGGHEILLDTKRYTLFEVR